MADLIQLFRANSAIGGGRRPAKPGSIATGGSRCPWQLIQAAGEYRFRVDRTNRNTALASAFAEELARSGLRDAVISPGSRSTPLALALWREPSIRARVILDERSAGYFALGAAQATGRPVAVACTSGTAAANLHPAVCEASEAAVPLIVLTADRPPELRDIGAGQTIDQLKLYGPAVRWFCEAGTHEADDSGLLHMRAVACRAFAAAAGDPRPGPVHVNLSWRDPLGPEPGPGDVTATARLALEGRGTRPLTSVTVAPPAPSPELIGEVAGEIARAPRGLILAGRQADPTLAPLISGLARAAGYPVLAEPTSQVRLGPHPRELVVWAYDAIARVAPEELAPELVIRFGDLPTSKALREWLASLPALRHVVVDPHHGWNEPSRMAMRVIRADPVALCSALVRVAGERPDSSWTRAWLGAAEAAAIAIAGELDALEEPTEPGLHAALGGLYGDGDIVYTASSMPIRDQEAFLPATPAAVRFLCNRGANGIDGLVSAGIGAAAASGRPTWILTGDLGLVHDLGGLEALRHASAPVRIVVLDNRGGGIFEFLPQASQVPRDEFEALFGTPSGLDFERLAALFGLRYARVERLAELPAAAEPGTGLIVVPADRGASVALHRRIQAAAAAAIERALAAAAPA